MIAPLLISGDVVGFTWPPRADGSAVFLSLGSALTAHTGSPISGCLRDPDEVITMEILKASEYLEPTMSGVEEVNRYQSLIKQFLTNL